MVHSPLYRMADRLAGGRLAEVLLDDRLAGFSFDEISRRLYADFGIEVTRQTLTKWVDIIEDTRSAVAS